MSFLTTSLALAMVSVACASAPETETDNSAGAIIGGFDAKHASYDAVGAMVVMLPDGRTIPTCTATLIGPKLIVTAKHCFLPMPRQLKLGFAIGFDGEHPRKVVPIADSEWEKGRVSGTLMSLGSDVAVGHLAEAITDVTPLAVDTARETDLGRKALAVGYGIQDATPDGPGVEHKTGTRKAATLTVRAREGAYWPLIYPNYDAFKQELAIAAQVPIELPELETAAQDMWTSMKLLPDYDLIASSDDMGTTTCNGDSGGPILRVQNGVRTVIGVVSGVIALPIPGVGQCLKKLTIYGGFGPEAKHLIDSASSCGGTKQTGSCTAEGQATRCTRADEGPPRVVSNDCGAVEMECAATPKEPVCAPKCTSNADCESLAANGLCDTASGKCSWKPACVDEGSPFACSLCCAGTEPNPEACTAQCQAAFAPPVATQSLLESMLERRTHN